MTKRELRPAAWSPVFDDHLDGVLDLFASEEANALMASVQSAPRERVAPQPKPLVPCPYCTEDQSVGRIHKVGCPIEHRSSAKTCDHAQHYSMPSGWLVCFVCNAMKSPAYTEWWHNDHDKPASY